MRILFLTVVLFFILGVALSQSSSRNFVGISIGPSFPSGDFAKTDLADSTSGWAKTGVALNFNYAHRFTHNFGVTAVISYSSNNFDGIKYGDALMNADSNYSVSVETSSSWSGGGIMVGPYLRFPLSDNLSWDIRAVFGFFAAYSPNLTIRATNTSTDPPEKLEYYRQRGSAFSYSYSFGTGFKYQLSKYYALLFADFLKSPLKFENASGWNWNNEPYKTKFSQEISYIYVTIGIGYFF